MTTEINKYHTSKIYRISSPQCEKFYIGSTTQTLKERLRHHKLDYKRYIEKGNERYLTSFEVVKFDDAIIELIKNVNCENRKELDRIEGDCIKEHHDRILNKNVAGRTLKEYRETHKNEIKDRMKDYGKEYREVYKNEIKENKKKYREAHKNEIKDRMKQYYEARKDKLNEKFDCDCGGKYLLHHKTRHTKTKKHQLFISNQL
ncbi:MAG: hypothetical protein EBR82_85715 [Caulobacteraceae bacterium]|nr:hypothetical protein [Caulobacteraceae bacterium]